MSDWSHYTVDDGWIIMFFWSSPRKRIKEVRILPVYPLTSSAIEIKYNNH